MKKIVTLSALSLGVLLLTGCGQQLATQTQPTTPSDYQTYKNDKYGFEFQYPKTWSFDEGALRFNPNTPQNCGPNVDETKKEPMCLDGIYFSIDKNDEKLAIDKYFEKNGWTGGVDYKDLKERKIGNVTAYTVTMTSGYDGKSEESFWAPLRDGSFFNLHTSYLVNNEKDVFNQMITTFKFTK